MNAPQVRQVNMLPELIRMTCTMYGAWGPASASSKLMQLRALDFGATPFANYTVLQVSTLETFLLCITAHLIRHWTDARPY